MDQASISTTPQPPMNLPHHFTHPPFNGPQQAQLPNQLHSSYPNAPMVNTEQQQTVFAHALPLQSHPLHNSAPSPVVFGSHLPPQQQHQNTAAPYSAAGDPAQPPPLQPQRQLLPAPQPVQQQLHPQGPKIAHAPRVESARPSQHQPAYLDQKVMPTQAPPSTLPPDGPTFNRRSGKVVQTGEASSSALALADPLFEIAASTDAICNRLDEIMEELLGGEFPILAPWQMTTYRQQQPTDAEIADLRERERKEAERQARCATYRAEMCKRGASDEEIQRGVSRIAAGQPADEDIQVIRDVINLTEGATVSKRARLSTDVHIIDEVTAGQASMESDLNDALELLGLWSPTAGQTATAREPEVNPANRVSETGNDEKRTETFPQLSINTPVVKPSQIPRKVPKHRPITKKTVSTKIKRASKTRQTDLANKRLSKAAPKALNTSEAFLNAIATSSEGGKQATKTSTNKAVENTRFPARNRKSVTFPDFETDLSGRSTSRSVGRTGRKAMDQCSSVFGGKSKKKMTSTAPSASKIEFTTAFATSERQLSKQREQRMVHYKDASVLTKFPQITKTTDIILSDFAASIGKSMKELIAENNKVWDSIDKISDKLTEDQMQACEQRMTKNDDSDVRKLLHLFAFFNGFKANASLDRISGMFSKLKGPSTTDAIAHLENFSHLLLFKYGPVFDKHHLYIDGKAIPVDGGLRLAILSLVAATFLFDIEFHPPVGDVAKFFYLSAGLTLDKVPIAVKNALKIARG